MEQIRTTEKIALALSLAGAVVVAVVCCSLAFAGLAGCSSALEREASSASSSGGGGGVGGDASTSSSSSAGGAGGGVCVSWELGADPNWQVITDRCSDMFGLPEPLCCNSAEQQPGCVSSDYVDPDCGLVWCCP